ncbi:TPA: hypothetical protein ACH9SG_004913 [Escherichia coli]
MTTLTQCQQQVRSWANVGRVTEAAMATPFFHVDVQQPAEMRFNRARVRRAFVTIGQRHMRDARRLVMRRARSAPGENPGYCNNGGTGTPCKISHHP